MAREIIRSDGEKDTSGRRRGRTQAEWDVDLVIGTRARKRRQILGLTQAQVGERLGMAFQVIQKLEIGQTAFTVTRVLELAVALEMPYEELIRGLTIELPKKETGDRSE